MVPADRAAKFNKKRSLVTAMRKLQAIAVHKRTAHHIYHISKSRDLIANLRDTLSGLGFSGLQTSILLAPLGDPDDNFSARPYSSRLYTDRYFVLENPEYLVEVFFGQRRAVLSIFGRRRPLARDLFADRFVFS